METWKPIPNYEGLYEVSNLGNVKSLRFNKEKILKPSKNNNGYFFVGLCKNCKSKTRTIHQLVAEASNFIDETTKKINEIRELIKDAKNECEAIKIIEDYEKLL
jgi:mevalonate pyrophosphate decarboxylase